MELEQAQAAAFRAMGQLALYCERIEVAGSIRRNKPEVGDVELVCIPRTRFLPQFCEAVKAWKKVKGEPTGKYTQRILPEGIYLDLFMVSRQNWGLIFAIRTGPADYSHLVLARGWVAAGYKCEGGYLHKNGEVVPVLEEQDLYALIGKQWEEPWDRRVL